MPHWQEVRPLDVCAYLELDKASRASQTGDDAHLVNAEQRCSRAHRAWPVHGCIADHERDAVQRAPSFVLVRPDRAGGKTEPAAARSHEQSSPENSDLGSISPRLLARP